MADFIPAWIGERPHLKIHRASRIHELCRFIKSLKPTQILETDPKFSYALQSMKDLNEYHFVIAVLGDLLSTEPFLSRLHRSIDDSAVNTKNSPHTPGRDAQFELFIGAVGHRAGFQMTDMGEGKPDWQLDLPTTRFTIECKRIKTLASLERHIKKASTQILTSGVGGVIIVDIGLMDSPTPLWLGKHLTDDAMSDAQHHRAVAFFKDYETRIKQAIGSAPVGSIMIHDYVVTPSEKQSNTITSAGGLMGFWDNLSLTVRGSDQWHRFNEFHAIWTAALPQASGRMR